MIAVIGGEGTTEDDARHAYEVGFEIGRRGHVLVCGGMGGVMREACRGVADAGGVTIGILPGEAGEDANEFVRYRIVTGMGAARNAIVARTGDALIAIGGRYGTLSEIAFGLIAGKPVVGIGSWDLVLPTGEQAPVITVGSAADAVDVCEAAAGGRGC
jgi:uncharacterized protein (TIGR00725 family)